MTHTEAMMIDCGAHGERISAVLCRHLLNVQPAAADFIENSDDPDDLQAWCYSCEENFRQ